MSSSITNVGEQKMLDMMFGGDAKVANYYIGLGTTGNQPTEAGAGYVEAETPGNPGANNGYDREAIANDKVTGFNAAVGGDPSTVDTQSAVTFGQATADWASGVDLAWVLVFDAATGGNLVAYIDISNPRPVLISDIFFIPSGELIFTAD